jgi:hypothetical protein
MLLASPIQKLAPQMWSAEASRIARGAQSTFEVRHAMQVRSIGIGIGYDNDSIVRFIEDDVVAPRTTSPKIGTFRPSLNVSASGLLRRLFGVASRRLDRLDEQLWFVRGFDDYPGVFPHT